MQLKLFAACSLIVFSLSARAQETEIFLGPSAEVQLPASTPVNYLARCLANPDDNVSCYLARTATTDGGLESVVNGQLEATSYVACEAQGGVCLELATLDLGENSGDDIDKQRLPSVDVTILFEYDSAAVQENEQAKLDQLARALKDPVNADARFAVIGHTDAKGDENYNCRLSRRRAQAVAEQLAALQFPASRTVAVGAGEFILKNADNGGADENRRVGFARIKEGPDEVMDRMTELCKD